MSTVVPSEGVEAKCHHGSGHQGTHAAVHPTDPRLLIRWKPSGGGTETWVTPDGPGPAPEWTNLADVVGQDDGHRVASLGIAKDEVLIVEACDDWFGIGLNAEQVDKLITWLQDAKAELR